MPSSNTASGEIAEDILEIGHRIATEYAHATMVDEAGEKINRAIMAERRRRWPEMRDPRPDETLEDYYNQIPQFAEVVVVGVVIRLIKRAQAEERGRCLSRISPYPDAYHALYASIRKGQDNG